MGCNTCRSSCGDCSEGGISFKRVLRPDAPARTAHAKQPAATPPSVAPLDQLAPAQATAAQPQKAAA